MAKYVCKNCNYHFEMNNAEECRFCGMESLEVERNAQGLLEDIDSIFG